MILIGEIIGLLILSFVKIKCFFYDLPSAEMLLNLSTASLMAPAA